MCPEPPSLRQVLGVARIDSSVGQNNSYIYGIDLVRFMAALAVTAFHFTWNNSGAPWLMPFGWVGVEVFFVISGLVIANSAFGATTRSFALGRFLRLYPGAWCAAAISAAILLAVPARSFTAFGIDARFTLRGFAGSLCLLGPRFLASAYWTLPIELSFYFIILLMVHYHRIGQIQRLAAGLTLWSGIYLAPFALNRLALTHLPWSTLRYGWLNMTLLRHGIFFALGILIWLAGKERITRIGWFTMAVALPLAAVEIASRAVELAPTIARSARAVHPSAMRLAIASCAAFYFAFLAIALSVYLNQRFPVSKSLRRAVRTLGLATYPLYLTHETIGGLVLLVCAAMGLRFLPSVFLALVMTCAISFLVASIWEPALRRRIRQLIDPQSRPAVPGS